MKIKNILLSLAFFNCVYAAPYDWHTASGNSYNIYETFEWAPQSKENKKPGTLFLISYQTHVTDKNDAGKFLAECNDILTHYYYFYLPEIRKKMSFNEKKNHHVVIRAFFKKPEEGKQYQSVNFTQSINGIEKIAKENKNIDAHRLEGLKFLSSGMVGDAAGAFEKIETKNAHDYVVLGETFHRAKKFPDAIKYYELALKSWQSRDLASVKKDQQVKDIKAQLKRAQQNKPL